MEPPRKVIKTEDLLKDMIGSVQDIFFNKLESMEEKIEKINTKYLVLEKKVDNVISTIQGAAIDASHVNSSVENPASEDPTVCAERDYPDGSWLGDPSNPNLCMRCPITPKDLEHINNTCSTAEKMSLTLLDYLFPREVQAYSNISGTGRHGKKQLDPYKIEGIQYHVTHMFGITEDDWSRIKLSIDSKCRTMFRKKLKGLPLNVRGEKARSVYKCEKKAEEENHVVLTEFEENLSLSSEIMDQQVLISDDESSLTDLLPVKIERY